MPKIALATINARYIHSSIALRYLMANMGDLQSETELYEFTLEQRPVDIAERLLIENPAIIALGVYIWNIEASTQLVAVIKSVSPETTVILGGPEVSHEWESQPIVQQSDYLIRGPGDLRFAWLCRELLQGNRPMEKIFPIQDTALDDINLPYRFYNDEDIANRVIYVEASRGCPFKCEFCLSALDKQCQYFDIDRFLDELARLYQRGVRHFKFTDRTFNLNRQVSCTILDFFLTLQDDSLFLHFEVIPDHLPEEVKTRIQRFPDGTLQLEIGIQSFNSSVQELISRRQNDANTRANMTWLRNHTHAHLHADLIIGLPGEDIESFKQGFNQLVALNPHEIQVGILKRLKGTPITRHDERFSMRYNPNPPYNLLSNDRIDFLAMQRLSRFARYWEMIANSGHFGHSLPLILGDDPFERFLQLSDWLYETTRQTHKIKLNRLFRLLYDGMIQRLAITPEATLQGLHRDFRKVDYASFKRLMENRPNKNEHQKKRSPASRQERHD